MLEFAGRELTNGSMISDFYIEENSTITLTDKK